MPKFAIQPFAKDGQLIARAKTSVEAPSLDHKDVNAKIEYAAKRAGSRLEEIRVIDSKDDSLQLVWSHGQIVQPVKAVTEPAKPALVKQEHATAFRTDGKKGGKNSECRKAKVRQAYMDGISCEDAMELALSLMVKSSSFKSWWGEFNRLQYPRKGIRK